MVSSHLLIDRKDGDDDDDTHAPNPALRRYGIRNRKRKKSMGAFASFRKSDSLLLSSMSYSMSGARARVGRRGQSWPPSKNNKRQKRLISFHNNFSNRLSGWLHYHLSCQE